MTHLCALAHTSVVRHVLCRHTYFCPGAMRTAWGTIGTWLFHSQSHHRSMSARNELGLLASCCCCGLCQDSACCNEHPRPFSEHVTVVRWYLRSAVTWTRSGHHRASHRASHGPTHSMCLPRLCFFLLFLFFFAKWIGTNCFICNISFDMNQLSFLTLLCKVLSIAFVYFSWLFGASLCYFAKPFCISRAISSCPASDLPVCLPLWCAWIFFPLFNGRFVLA